MVSWAPGEGKAPEPEPIKNVTAPHPWFSPLSGSNIEKLYIAAFKSMFQAIYARNNI